ncbi:MAG: type II toxin-antitoxin system VapC family toxin [Cyanobium sp.]
MILIDTNVWLYACLSDTPHHPPCRAWLEDVLSGEEPIALPWQVAISVLRISTQPKLLSRPLTLEQALQLVEGWLSHPLVEVLTPGERHWSIQQQLLLQVGIAGNLSNDVHLAALALEHDCSLCSADADFRRFPGLRLINPLA